MSKLDEKERYRTLERLADACMAKRAQLIDCKTCSLEATCNNMWASKTSQHDLTDQELTERHFS